MPDKDPSTYTLLTCAWVFVLSMLGGVVSFARKMREGVVRAFNFTEFIGELITSAFAGVMTFYLCEWSGVAPLLSAVLIGISGHMGSRAIFGIERWAEKRITGMRGP